MKIETAAIPDILLLRPKIYQDERGFFAEMTRDSRLRELGLGAQFVQDNLSGSKAGVLRGLHYQICHAQGKLIRATTGRVFDVAVDLRHSSPTFAKWVGFELDSDEITLLWIPPGFAHGYYVLSPWAEIQYRVTDYYAPNCERTLIWNDPSIGIDWPIEVGAGPHLSDRDKSGLPLAELDLFE